MNFSLEIGPHTDLETLPSVNDVYVTMLPGGDYKETAEKSGDLVKKGFNPVPHFPARSIADENQLKNKEERTESEGPLVMRRSTRKKSPIKRLMNEKTLFQESQGSRKMENA